jgi:hypothetical protein
MSLPVLVWPGGPLGSKGPMWSSSVAIVVGAVPYGNCSTGWISFTWPRSLRGISYGLGAMFLDRVHVDTAFASLLVGGSAGGVTVCFVDGGGEDRLQPDRGHRIDQTGDALIDDRGGFLREVHAGLGDLFRLPGRCLAGQDRGPDPRQTVPERERPADVVPRHSGRYAEDGTELGGDELCERGTSVATGHHGALATGVTIG